MVSYVTDIPGVDQKWPSGCESFEFQWPGCNCRTV